MIHTPRIAGVALAALIIAFIIGQTCVYTLDERQQAVITRFGRVRGAERDAGLHLKLPIDKINTYEKRIVEWDGASTEIPTKDKKFILVNTCARWRIVDPVKFLETRRTEAGGQAMLDQNIESATRDLVSSHTLIELVRTSNRELGYEEDVLQAQLSSSMPQIQAGRQEITRQIRDSAREGLEEQYGMELIDVRIKHINYQERVREAVYERMKSERQRIAQRLRAEGEGEQARVLGEMQRDLDSIESEGYREAEEIRGLADAEVLRIYADAYEKDPDLYAFMETLKTYEAILSAQTTLVLTTDGELFRYLKDPSPETPVPVPAP